MMNGTPEASRLASAYRIVLLAVLSQSACSSPPAGPDLDTPAAVVVEPATALLVSIGDTVMLNATVRNGASQSISAPVTWTSNDMGVVVVDTEGRAVAVGNGAASITATAGSVSGAVAVTVEQIIDSISMVGEAQAGDVLAPLDSAIVVTLLDARSHPIANAPVTFSITSGGGSVSPADVTTNAVGTASTTWTLGPTTGIHELDFVAGFSTEGAGMFTANAYPLSAKSLTLHSGDGQSELVSTSLPEPIRVQVLDSLGNGVPGVLVTFDATGDALLDGAEVYTDLDGVAGVGLVLGSTIGGYDVVASVADSLTVTGLPLSGSPVNLSAEAVAYTLSPASLLVTGDTVTLDGTGFHPTLDANSVQIGGLTAEILGGSQTELVVEVPSFGCTPERGHMLEVSRTGSQASQSVTVTPAGALVLAVGEQMTLDDTNDFCLQFLAASNDEYLVGLTSTSWFDGAATFSISTLDTLGPFPVPSPAPAASGAPLSEARLESASAASHAPAAYWSAELALRAWESELVAGVPRSSLSLAPTPAPPVEGDQLQLRLPDLTRDPCLDYVPINAEVFSVGARLSFATTGTVFDPQDPLIVLLLEALNTLHTNFGDTGVDLIMGFLGAPALWDADSRVTVVLGSEVGAMGVPAYASAVDQLPRTVCPASDEGHYIYVEIPNAATIAQVAAVIEDTPPDLAHHIAHIVQWTRRLTSGGNLLPSWLAEGQAELIVEHVGMTLSGLGAQQDLGSAVLALPGISDWIPQRFDRLSRFHGWDGAAGTLPGAPEGCSLFGFTTSVCDPEAGPGAAWSFLRYVSDRFGPQMIGGEPGLHHALIDLDPTEDPIIQVETLLGVTLSQLVVDWAGMLYADGRLTPVEAPTLQMTSWKLLELIPAGPKRLAPHVSTFTDFSRSGSLSGGGTAYSLVSSGGAHGALALSVGDGLGGPVPAPLRPRLWVVRMR